jgi:hypothetical protein
MRYSLPSARRAPERDTASLNLSGFVNRSAFPVTNPLMLIRKRGLFPQRESVGASNSRLHSEDFTYQGIGQYLRPIHSFLHLWPNQNCDIVGVYLATDGCEKGSPMIQFVHAAKVHITPNEGSICIAHAPATGSKAGSLATKWACSRTVLCLLFGLLALAPNSWAQTRPPILEQVAKTYGLDSYGQIEAIRYTWSAQFPGVDISRSWVWEPKTNKISYDGKDKEGKPLKVSYSRSELASQSDVIKNVVDPAFLNDNYWLLFPLHAYWDTSATVTDQGMHKLPLGNGSAELVAVKYPKEGGYTPGDTWELYVGKVNRVEQFVYHRGGPTKPSLVIATWAGYKKAGPLLISTEHRGTADGKPLHISISDVAVKVTGSDTWMKAE